MSTEHDPGVTVLRVAKRDSCDTVFSFFQAMVELHSAVLTERDEGVLDRALEDYSFRFTTRGADITACSGAFVTSVPGIFELGGTAVVERRGGLCTLLTSANVLSGHFQKHRLITRIARSNNDAREVAKKLRFIECGDDLPEQLRQDDLRQYPEGSWILEPSTDTYRLAAITLLVADGSASFDLTSDPLRQSEHMWKEIERMAQAWQAV